MMLPDLECRRRIGVGEREHVRHDVLSVLLTSKLQLSSQVLGALKAADTLKMRLRLHLNAGRLGTAEALWMNEALTKNPECSTRFHYNLSEKEFRENAALCDLVLFVRSRFPKITGDEVQQQILRTWTDTNGRFLNGNFALLKDDMLQRMYPEMYWDLSEAYEEFKS